ncbi:ParB/RepB/Spo0J family partition protein [Tautonia plasticadhaerens]|uniref:Chromosome-partitioning protein ParB n=1 Tax=Tautonia plasticadhaerens TaxID=2527974 RepID=A0A518HE09_9BACT|nr:ParB/RepB/Spo0J family partition protein [Tautonia plasticadhaerens]QDV39084.1 Chromosome-partitioning protein ParB [Tautonia plasticadhaerens]
MSKKLESLRKSAGGNVRESMGAERPVPSAGQGGAAPGGPPARWQGVTKARDAALIPVDRITNDPDQPRKEFDPEALERLAESLKVRGQLQPIRVRWDEDRQLYIVLVGERRWRAARLAGLPALSCIVHEARLDADERLMVQLVENALREDLKPVEQARAYRALMDANSWSGRQLAEELHVGQASVVRALSLLELPGEVQERVDSGDLAPSVAYEIGKLPDPGQQAEVARAVVAEGLNRSEVGQVIQSIKARRPSPSPRPDPETIDLGDGITVTIKWRKPSTVGVVQALRRALSLARGLERESIEGVA